MADILYTYKKQVYANITNRCNCNCRFCIRHHADSVGETDMLWHEKEPTLEEIKKAIDEFDFTEYDELVYCGYGEPTCALENLIASAAYVKDRCRVKIRLNTNGLANRCYGRNVIPDLAQVVDSVSISLNAPTAEKYQSITRPQYEGAFGDMLAFATMVKEAGIDVKFSVVDILTEEEIKECRALAEKMGITLRVREYA